MAGPDELALISNAWTLQFVATHIVPSRLTALMRDSCLVTDTDFDQLMTPAEVAAFFGVDPKTVTRWAKCGRLSSVRTLGGHRRYSEREVRELRCQALSQRLG
jgi:excisionase family DNA binding protein